MTLGYLSPFEVPDDDPLSGTSDVRLTTALELREFVTSRSDQEAIEGLAAGDPLGLRIRTGQWLKDRTLMLDLRAVIYGTLPYVVCAAGLLDGSENLDRWLEGSIDVSAQGLLEEDARLVREEVPASEPYEPRFHFMMVALMFNIYNVRQAIDCANSLPDDQRHALYHVIGLGTSFVDYGRELGIKHYKAYELVMRAVEQLNEAVGDV